LTISSSNELFQPEQNGMELQTIGHNIGVRRINPTLEWLPQHMSVEAVSAWQFYFAKRNASQEQVTVSMKLLSVANVDTGAETGENLVAVGFERESRQLHLGTEDEEPMAQRAGENDWMPRRLQTALNDYSLEVTTIASDGLQTVVPPLEAGEQFYFHYIIAENPRRNSTDYPAEPDISTWFAVDQSKSQLEKFWH
jgi:hypothetical protein